MLEIFPITFCFTYFGDDICICKNDYSQNVSSLQSLKLYSLFFVVILFFKVKCFNEIYVYLGPIFEGRF